MALLLCNPDLDAGTQCRVRRDEGPAGQSYCPQVTWQALETFTFYPLH